MKPLTLSIVVLVLVGVSQFRNVPTKAALLPATQPADENVDALRREVLRLAAVDSKLKQAESENAQLSSQCFTLLSQVNKLKLQLQNAQTRKPLHPDWYHFDFEGSPVYIVPIDGKSR